MNLKCKYCKTKALSYRVKLSTPTTKGYLCVRCGEITSVKRKPEDPLK